MQTGGIQSIQVDIVALDTNADVWEMLERCKSTPSEEAKSDLESKRRQESVKKIMGFGTSEWLDTQSGD